MIASHSRFRVVFCFVLVLASAAFAQETREIPESRPAPAPAPAPGEEARNRERDDVIEDFETIVITATRTPRQIMNVPASVFTKTRDEIVLEDLSRTLVDSLRYTPGVTVQKTSYGQSSPYFRGLTGYHTLLMVDGIRLNDSVLRAGPNDLWSTVDPYSVGSYELVLGPSSVLYGSDSMGGTLNVLPHARTDYSKPYDCDRRLIARYGSAEQTMTYRAEVEGNVGDCFGFVVGGTEAEFDDLRAGGDVGEQPHTGYGFHALDGCFDFKLTNKWNLRVLSQAVSLDDVRRTHQTIYGISYHGTTVGTDRRRTLDFERELGAITLDGHDLCGAVDRARFQVSYQHYGENQDRIRSNGQRNKDGFDVHTLGLVANASSKTRIGYLTYGVDSTTTTSTPSGTTSTPWAPSPAPPSRASSPTTRPTTSLGAYVQDELALGKCWSADRGRAVHLRRGRRGPRRRSRASATSRSRTSGRTSSAPRASSTGRRLHRASTAASPRATARRTSPT